MKPAFGAFKTLGAMFGIGVALMWGTIFAIPLFERIGMSHAAANRVPIFFFAAGAAWGLSMYFSEKSRAAFGYFAFPFIMGVVCWFISLFLGGVLIFFGLPTFAADRLPPAGFVIGLCFGGMVPLFGAIDVISSLRGRLAARNRRPPIRNVDSP